MVASAEASFHLLARVFQRNTYFIAVLKANGTDRRVSALVSAIALGYLEKLDLATLTVSYIEHDTDC